MVSEDNERTAVEEVVKLGYSSFYGICLALSDGPILLCWTEDVQGYCNYFLSSIFSFLHEDGTTGSVTDISGECEESCEVEE